MKKIEYPSCEELYHKYIILNYSCEELMQYYNMSKTTFFRLLKKYNIKKDRKLSNES